MKFYIHGQDGRYSFLVNTFNDNGISSQRLDCVCQVDDDFEPEVYVKPAKNSRDCWTRVREVVEENVNIQFYLIGIDQMHISQMRNVIGLRNNLSYIVEGEFGERMALQLDMARTRQR